MLIEIFERNLLTVIDQVRSISEVIDSADEEELPPPPQEQVAHHLHHHHHQHSPPPQEQVAHHHHRQQIKDMLFSTIVYIINHNNIMFQHVSLAKVFGNITPTTSIMESIILKKQEILPSRHFATSRYKLSCSSFSDAGKREKRASNGN